MSVGRGRIKVMIVDDSAFMRRVISDMLSEEEDIEVVGVAKNGLEAVRKVELFRPDVITLDVEMPVMDGLTCLKKLLEKGPYSVVMLSSVTSEGAKATIEALEYGAVDFITKPENIFQVSSNDKKKEIVQKIKIAKDAVKKKIVHRDISERRLSVDVNRSREIKNIIAIGTSTGGPRALQSVIPFLPGDIPAAVLVVQHMPPGFTKSLAARLNDMSEMTVKEAENGEKVTAGFVYIAPGDKHMFLVKEGSGFIIKTDNSPPVSGHRPSVDAMLYSIAESKAKNLVSVIMTGMGSDGSKGLKKVKAKNNSYIIAQDEKTCVVYGMPRVAVEMGIVDEVVPLRNIAGRILSVVGVQG